MPLSSSWDSQNADGETGCVGGAERGRLGHGGPHDRQPQHVGLDLEQQLVRGHAAVDAQLGQRDARVGDHGLHQLARRIGGRLERRARECALVWKRVRPQITPRASGRQRGA